MWVGAAPELLFIPDRNRDDVPDGPPQVLLEGFGYQDTHECLNSFMWGPDGWLYGNQGVFNYSRIGKPGVPAPAPRMEVVGFDASGLMVYMVTSMVWSHIESGITKRILGPMDPNVAAMAPTPARKVWS